MATGEYVRVRSGYVRGGQVVRGGQALPANSPLVKGMPPEYFEPLGEAVERATRRPGEVRITPGTGPSAVLMRATKAAKRGRPAGD